MFSMTPDKNLYSAYRSETPPPDPKVMQQQAAGKRLQQQQAQVDEVCVSLLLLSLWFELTCSQSSYSKV